MQSGTRRTSGVPTDTGSIIGDAAVRVKAAGGGHAKAVEVAFHCGGDVSVVFQTTVATPEASWWVVIQSRQFSCHRVTQS